MASPVIPLDLRLTAMLGSPPEQVEARGLGPRGLHQNGEGVPYDFQVLERHQVWARHVAYGTGRVRGQLQKQPQATDRFVAALEERITFARDVSGIPSEIQEAIAVLAGEGDRGGAFVRGVQQVAEFQKELRENRVRRLAASGFPDAAAKHISDLHAKASGNAM